MFLAQTFVIVFLFAVLGSAALCIDGLTAISAFEFVAQQIDGFGTTFAVMVFLYFGAHCFKNIGRHDLRKHIFNNLSVKMIDACVFFVFQSAMREKRAFLSRYSLSFSETVKRK